MMRLSTFPQCARVERELLAERQEHRVQTAVDALLAPDEVECLDTLPTPAARPLLDTLAGSLTRRRSMVRARQAFCASLFLAEVPPLHETEAGPSLWRCKSGTWAEVEAISTLLHGFRGLRDRHLPHIHAHAPIAGWYAADALFGRYELGAGVWALLRLVGRVEDPRR